MTGERRKLCRQKLRYFYLLLNTDWLIKSREKREMGPVSHVGVKEVVCRVWCGNLVERNHLDNVGVDGMIIVNCIFKKKDGSVD